MRHLSKAALMLGGLGLTFAATPALAGGCGYGGAQNCDAGVTVNMHGAPVFGSTSVNIQQPMGHLRSVQYTRSPNVTITRLHGMQQTASVSDAPSSFTGGCHPTSTAYCRSDAGRPVNVQMSAPQISAPYMSGTVMAPTYQAPMISAALPAPRVVAVGGGYDPSKFIPRVYGDNTLVPGIAHVPTSFVDRDPSRAAMALQRAGQMGYSTSSYSSGYTSGSVSTGYNSGSIQLGGGTQMMPQTSYQGGRQIGSVVNYVQSASTASTPSGVDSSGGYWEKVSGVTRFGDTIATQVICRRQAPQPTPTVQRVVRPVIGVPTPVPTPVPYTVNVPAQCMPMPAYAAQRPHMGGFAGPKAPIVPVPQPLRNGRWVY